MAVEKGDKGGDKGAAQPVQEGADASEKLRPDLSVINSLHLKDPGKLTTADMLGNGYLNVPPIDAASPMNDPRKFLNVANKLLKSDPDGKLTKADLAAISESPKSTADQKTVARELTQNYDRWDTRDKDSMLYPLSFVIDVGGKIQQDGLDRMKEIADAAALFSKHPELNDPKTLAATLEGIRSKLPNHDHGLAEHSLGGVLRSNEFTDSEKAAAELAQINFSVLSDLDKDGYAGLIDKKDMQVIARNGKPAEVAEVKPGCEEHTSPTGNALKWGVGVGAVSKVSGSDQSLLNAAVAATSAAIAASIKNEICEK
ncbi:MAG: hypothetical protein Q8T09_16350 [Candidatus Melainabacteria bacterium]|nr:hypothetical protein [Candidatus Melainabacteria bacterium]